MIALLFLFAQPIVSTKDNSKCYEVLIRLSNVDGGMIYPDQFISVCNNAGISSCLDLCVIEQAFQYISNKGLAGVRFSINLMPSTICKEFFFSRTASLFHLNRHFQTLVWSARSELLPVRYLCPVRTIFFYGDAETLNFHLWNLPVKPVVMLPVPHCLHSFDAVVQPDSRYRG